MLSNQDTKTGNNKSINLNLLLSALFDKKSLIIAVTIIFAITSIFISLQIPNKYKSSALLSINKSSDSGIQSTLAGITAQYGGLASMAGISLPGSESSDKSYIIINTIKSRVFLNHLINKDPNILQNLIASEGYNKETNIIIYDDKIYDSSKSQWVRKPTKYYGSKPSYLELHEVFDKEVLSINLDKITGLIKISITTVSPEYSKSLLDLIIYELNATSRQKDIDLSTNTLNYLQDLNNNTSQENIKKSISNLIESQIKVQMLANIEDDYMVQFIDPPFIPEIKASPSRALICIIITLIGFLLSVLYVLITLFRKNNN